MAAVVCSDCYNPACARSLNAAQPCNCTDFFAVVRNANNTYDNAVYAALPTSANAVTTNHLDALRGFAAVVQMAPISAAATALYNGGAALPAGGLNAGQAWFFNVDGVNLGDLFHLVEIYKHHPTQRHLIRNHLEQLQFTAAQAGQRAAAGDALRLLVNFDTQLQTVKSASTSADDFENRKYPLSRLYFIVTKANVAGPLTMAQSGLTSGRLDKDTGQALLTFEKLKPVEDINTLHLIMNDFQRAVLVIGKNGGRLAWAPFWEVISSLCRTKPDAPWLHELIFESLTWMDSHPTVNPLVFMQSHWQTFIITFGAKWGEKNEPAGGGPPHHSPKDNEEDSQPPGTGAVHIKFGPVTKQGQWSGEMRTRNGAIAFCNCWNQNKPCNRGVFAGVNKGKCAYTHKCRYCMSTKHVMDEKHPTGHAKAGEWVCTKHP